MRSAFSFGKAWCLGLLIPNRQEVCYRSPNGEQLPRGEGTAIDNGSRKDGNEAQSTFGSHRNDYRRVRQGAFPSPPAIPAILHLLFAPYHSESSTSSPFSRTHYTTTPCLAVQQKCITNPLHFPLAGPSHPQPHPHRLQVHLPQQIHHRAPIKPA